MAHIVKIPISQISESLLNEIMLDYGREPLVEVSLPERYSGDIAATDAFFWQIIEHLDWSQQNHQQVLQPAVQALSEKPSYQIFRFESLLAEKLHRLDTRKHAQAMMQNQPGQPFSGDGFLYTRCAVVAEGKDYFEQVLNCPDDMPADISFEPLLNLASKAYKLKTGNNFDFIPATSYETQSNLAQWT